MGDWLYDNLIHPMLDAMFGTQFRFVADTLRSDVFQTTKNTLTSAVSGFALPIGTTLVCIHFTLVLMDKVASDNFNTDQFVKLLLKLVLAIGIINNAGDLTDIIFNFGTEFAAGMTNVDPFTNPDFNGSFSLLQALAMLIVMLIPFIVSLVVTAIMYFMVYSYVLEYIIRMSLAPIGLADFMTGGPHSNGMRYLKSLIAMAMQGGIMILIMMGSASMVTNVIADAFGSGGTDGEVLVDLMTGPIQAVLSIIKALAVQIAGVSLMGTAKTIARDVVG